MTPQGRVLAIRAGVVTPACLTQPTQLAGPYERKTPLVGGSVIRAVVIQLLAAVSFPLPKAITGAIATKTALLLELFEATPLPSYRKRARPSAPSTPTSIAKYKLPNTRDT